MSEVADQFKGLPIGDLIGGPLTAACEAQLKLANATANFIQQVGFLPSEKGKEGAVREALFRFRRPTEPSADNPKPTMEMVEIGVPLLSIVNVPNLSIQTIDITFDMEVKSSVSSKETDDKKLDASLDAKFGFGPVSGNVKISGSIASHKENTRSSDNSAKYHISLHAEDKGMPEGLSRVLDIMQSAIAPRKIETEKMLKDTAPTT